jgi:hypothetical protein
MHKVFGTTIRNKPRNSLNRGSDIKSLPCPISRFARINCVFLLPPLKILLPPLKKGD